MRTSFVGREAVSVENDALRVTVLRGGGHVAEVFDKAAGVSPLWVPQWGSVEPSAYEAGRHPGFGTGADARLLAGIMGHSLCLDLFGGPSAEEASAGMGVHGEGSVLSYDIAESVGGVVASVEMPLAEMRFTRRVELWGRGVRMRETVENLASFDRPIAWTQHVTLGPPFLDPATTVFRASMTRGMVAETDPGENGYLQGGMPFVWPMVPRCGGGSADLRQMKRTAPASGYTALLADPGREDAFFVAFSPEHRLSFGCVWRRGEFPWMGIWEENCSRQGSPWDGREVTRGMEFGVSPFPETRREMVERGRLFGEATFRWLPARGRLEAEYWMVTGTSDEVPETVGWPGADL